MNSNNPFYLLENNKLDDILNIPKLCTMKNNNNNTFLYKYKSINNNQRFAII